MYSVMYNTLCIKCISVYNTTWLHNTQPQLHRWNFDSHERSGGVVFEMLRLYLKVLTRWECVECWHFVARESTKSTSLLRMMLCFCNSLILGFSFFVGKFRTDFLYFLIGFHFMAVSCKNLIYCFFHLSLFSNYMVTVTSTDLFPKNMKQLPTAQRSFFSESNFLESGFVEITYYDNI